MNQSGEGINFVTIEMIEKFELTKRRDSILSTGLSSCGIVNSSKTSPLRSFSRMSESPVVQKLIIPASASSPMSKSLKLSLCDTPKVFEK